MTPDATELLAPLQGGLTGNLATNAMLYRLARNITEAARRHIAADAACKAVEAQSKLEAVPAVPSGAQTPVMGWKQLCSAFGVKVTAASCHRCASNLSPSG